MHEELYIQRLIELLERLIHGQRPQIGLAADIVARCIMRGGVIHIFGTGHSSLIAQEPFMRAGGLLPVNALLDERILLSGGALASGINEKREGLAAEILSAHRTRSGDAGIVISNSGRNAAPVEMAFEMKKAGMPVIAITSISHTNAVASSHSSGKKLCDAADVALDNCAPYGDALIHIDGIETAMGAASTVTGAALIQAVFILAAEKMVDAGASPVALPSGNLAAVDYTRVQAAMEEYAGRIKYI